MENRKEGGFFKQLKEALTLRDYVMAALVIAIPTILVDHTHERFKDLHNIAEKEKTEIVCKESRQQFNETCPNLISASKQE